MFRYALTVLAGSRCQIMRPIKLYRDLCKPVSVRRPLLAISVLFVVLVFWPRTVNARLYCIVLYCFELYCIVPYTCIEEYAVEYNILLSST